jgi:hypothetical protein
MNPTDIAFIKGAIAFVLLASLRAENARDREDLETRMAELEARVQFTERLLVREKEPGRLLPPDADRPG